MSHEKKSVDVPMKMGETIIDRKFAYFSNTQIQAQEQDLLRDKGKNDREIGTFGNRRRIEYVIAREEMSNMLGCHDDSAKCDSSKVKIEEAKIGRAR